MNVSTFAARPVPIDHLPSPPGERSVVRLREPSARYWYSWTPALIRSAEVAAISGNLRLSADLCEWMMGDDRVAGVLDTYSDALLGLPFSVKPKGDRRTGKRVANDLEEDWDLAFPEAELKKLIHWGRMLGVGLAQLEWKTSEETGREVPCLTVWSPRWLSWDYQQGWMVEAVEEVDGERTSLGYPMQKRPITAGDRQWVIYTPSGASRPWIHGAYRALGRWTLLKQYAITDWGFYSDRLGQGVWVAETDVSKGAGTGTVDKRKELAADLQQMGRNSAIALLPGQTLRLIESVARNYDSFRQQIELADNGTAVSILGQNLSTQAATGGSTGAASLHGKVAHGRTRVLGKVLPKTLRDQVLVGYAEINYPQADQRTAPLPSWDTTPVDDEKSKAQTKQMKAQAATTAKNGGIITVNEARAELGYAPISGGDVLVDAKTVNPEPLTDGDGDRNDDLAGTQTPAEPVIPPPAAPNQDDDDTENESP